MRRYIWIKVIFLILFLPYGANSQTNLENYFSHGRLPYLKPSKLIQISSFDSTGGNDDRIHLNDGEKATIAEMKGPGIITRIWITIDSRDPYFLRRIVLRMYWDNEKNPSVEVPVGDFFGTGFRYKHYYSKFVGMTSGGYFCYFPMPFQSSARIEVENQTGQEVYAFYFHIDYQRLENPLDNNVAYFHAHWRRNLKTSENKNYIVLESKGQGHFVGMNMSMQSYDDRLWFLEGDEMIYVDNESFPSIYGTGTEDYFTSGWYFNRGEFASPYHGLIIKNDSLARIAAYRFHVGDAIPFKKVFSFEIEHGHANAEVADYSSTAYWYQKEPHQPFPPLPKASLRIPLRVTVPSDAKEAESLDISGIKISKKIEEMSDYGPDWSNLKQLKIMPEHSNEHFEINIPDVEEDKYVVDMYYTKGPDYGNIDIFHQNRKVGTIKGYHEKVYPGGGLKIKDLKVVDGKIPLEFVVESKEPNSKGYAVGFDALKIEPDREYIPEWQVIGPFPNPRNENNQRLGLDKVYPPEKEIDFSETYKGAENQKVKWQFVQTPKNGRIHLYNKFEPYELVVAYAVTYIFSPKKQIVPLLLGSDDGVKVFLNGNKIHRKLLVRISAPDQDRVALKLKKGWNELLLKIENNFGGYAFFARIIDLKDSLKYDADKER